MANGEFVKIVAAGGAVAPAAHRLTVGRKIEAGENQ
jgi:hypothetical protein